MGSRCQGPGPPGKVPWLPGHPPRAGLRRRAGAGGGRAEFRPGGGGRHLSAWRHRGGVTRLPPRAHRLPAARPAAVLGRARPGRTPRSLRARPRRAMPCEQQESGVPPARYVVGVDVGSTVVKCHVYDRAAAVRGSSCRKVSPGRRGGALTRRAGWTGPFAGEGGPGRHLLHGLLPAGGIERAYSPPSDGGFGLRVSRSLIRGLPGGGRLPRRGAGRGSAWAAPTGAHPAWLFQCTGTPEPGGDRTASRGNGTPVRLRPRGHLHCAPPGTSQRLLRPPVLVPFALVACARIPLQTKQPLLVAPGRDLGRTCIYTRPIA